MGHDVRMLRAMLLASLLTGFVFVATIYLIEVKTLGTSSPRTRAAVSLPMTQNLVQDDPKLVQEVREALVPPTPESEPYYLDSPDQKYFSEQKQDVIVERMLRGKRNGFFIEAGGYTGEFKSNTLFLERELGWKGVLIEPAPISFRTLQCKNRRAHLLNACLAPSNVSSVESFKYESNKSQGAQISSSEHRTVPVWCVPLYSVLLAFGNPVVDYFSLDVESFEVKVLRTIPWDKVNIKIISIEVIWAPEGKQAIMDFMRSRGYKLYEGKEKPHIDVIYYRPELL